MVEASLHDEMACMLHMKDRLVQGNVKRLPRKRCLPAEMRLPSMNLEVAAVDLYLEWRFMDPYRRPLQDKD